MGKPPFQALLDSHREHVYRFLVAMVGPVEADDCFQETFLSALRAYPRLREASNLRAWLMTIAHRKAIDAHRSRRRRAVPADPLPEPPPEAANNGEPALWEAVRGLPPKQRAAIVHRYVNDLPYAEIGRIVGCSEAAARQNVRAGLTNLRGAWAQ
jgi:RNA polymerase sigma factor (sigma-70 family)